MSWDARDEPGGALAGFGLLDLPAAAGRSVPAWVCMGSGCTGPFLRPRALPLHLGLSCLLGGYPRSLGGEYPAGSGGMPGAGRRARLHDSDPAARGRDELAVTLNAALEGWRRLASSAAWKRLAARLGIEGCIRAAEITYGANGWHLHLHVLVFTHGAMSSGDLAALEGVVFERWAAIV